MSELFELEQIELEDNKYIYIYYFDNEIALNIAFQNLDKKILVEQIEFSEIFTDLEYDTKKLFFQDLLAKIKDFNKNMIQVSGIENISTKLLDEFQEAQLISSYNDFGDMNIYIFF